MYKSHRDEHIIKHGHQKQERRDDGRKPGPSRLVSLAFGVSLFTARKERIGTIFPDPPVMKCAVVAPP